MKPNLKLFRHLFSGLFLITIVLIIFSIIVHENHKKQREKLFEMGTNYQPSVNALKNLSHEYGRIKSLMEFWINSPADKDLLFRDEFNLVFSGKIFPLTSEILILADEWPVGDAELMHETARLLNDSLYNNLQNLISLSYPYRLDKNSGMNDFSFNKMMDELSLLYSVIEQNLSYLNDKKNEEMANVLESFQVYNQYIRQLFQLLSLIILSIGFVTVLWHYRYISKAYLKISKALERLSEGDIPNDIEIKRQDAFSTLYSRMNNLFSYLTNLIKLSNQILEKDFSGNIKQVSRNDGLGIALVNLQESLMIATVEEEKRKKEDMERQWVSEGIARINDILRISEDKIEELSYQLTKEITDYTGSSLGAMFILNNEDPDDIYLQLSASYAYERRKYIHKKIEFGEGLVGRCAIERDTLHMTEIPEDYFTIQSGLGEGKPASILLVPLKLNETVYGVIEIASFNHFEKYQIQLIESIGENIAITVSKVKINVRTSYLLEQTRQQAEELSTQEEEMRQNMEELRANQEQAAIREAKLIKEIEQLRNRVARPGQQ